MAQLRHALGAREVAQLMGAQSVNQASAGSQSTTNCSVAADITDCPP